MKYDTTSHIPNQIEILFDEIKKPDLNEAKRTLDNLMNLITVFEKNNSFKKKLDEYKRNKEKSIQELEADILPKFKTEIQKSETITNIFFIFENYKNYIGTNLDEIERDYWNNIKEITLLHVHEEPREEEVEAVDNG